MKNFLFVLLFPIIFASSIDAQPSILWQKCLGGTQSDKARSVQHTNDGGFIISGETFSNDNNVTGNHGGSEYWVIKLDSSGSIQWQQCLGGSGFESSTSIKQTADSGYIVAGQSTSNDNDVSGNHGSNDYWVVKLNQSGAIAWQKCLGGYYSDYLWSIQLTNDDGYVVVGTTASTNGDVSGNHGDQDYWVVKLNSTGTIQWQKCLGGTGYDQAYAIQQTNDSGYIVAGFTKSNNGDVSGSHSNITYFADYWVVKLSSSGSLQWQKCLGGSRNDVATSIQQTNDSGYIVAGYSASNDGDVSGNHDTVGNNSDYWVVKLNSSGNLQWQKCLGGTSEEEAWSIQQTSDNGYIVAGDALSTDGNVTGNHGAIDYWLVKLDFSGALQWEKCFGGTSHDWAVSIQQNFLGEYIVAGTTISNNGDVSGYHGDYDYWIVKLSSFVGIEELKSPISNLQIFPNPVSTSADISFFLNQKEKISVTIYDITGRVIENILDGQLAPGSHQLKWIPTENQAVTDGVYFLTIKSAGFSKSCRLIVVQ